jgi:hypothetical protein
VKARFYDRIKNPSIKTFADLFAAAVTPTTGRAGEPPDLGDRHPA